jgi:hypothetical protein
MEWNGSIQRYTLHMSSHIDDTALTDSPHKNNSTVILQRNSVPPKIFFQLIPFCPVNHSIDSIPFEGSRTNINFIQ